MIYLMRHGETDWNARKIVQASSDIPLNEKGREQAKMASMEVIKLGIEHIFSSPLSRALETAEIVKREVGLDDVEIIIDSRLSEGFGGDLEGTPRKDLPEPFWEILEKYPEKYNIEPMQSLFDRAKSFFDEIVGKGLQNVLVVTHAGLLLAALYYAEHDKFDHDDFYAKSPQKNAPRNTAIIKWRRRAI